MTIIFFIVLEGFFSRLKLNIEEHFRFDSVRFRVLCKKKNAMTFRIFCIFDIYKLQQNQKCFYSGAITVLYSDNLN